VSLLECQFLLPGPKRLRLEQSWAHFFQQRILPLIDEEAFRDAFSDETGRPNKSIRVLTGLHLLKEWNDLTDAQVIEQYEFNLQWHYALGVEPAEAHVCQKTLHNFRILLLSRERAQQAFEALTRGLVELDDLDVGRQRLDSTHVISNIAVLTRLGLFTETTTKFLRELRREAPGKLAQLDGGYAERYLDRDGYFADATKAQARRRLPLVAVDVYRLVQALSQDEAVSQWESYRLLERLFEEQCEVGEEPEEPEEPEERTLPAKPRDAKTISSSSLQSPHDPDATYGRKGKGYEVQGG